MTTLATKVGLTLAGTLLTTLSATPAFAGITFTLEGAGAQETTLTGNIFTEDFESMSLGTSNNVSFGNGLGTMNVAKIESANKYGGAGGAGNYLRGGSSISFNEAQAYMGFWWSAGDGTNSIELFDEADESLGFYSTSLVSDFIDNLSETEKVAYSGNPNDNFLGQNSHEYYSYLNFFGTEGSKIKRVELNGHNFESDNFSFSTTARSTTGDILSGEATEVPEPGAILGLLATAAFGAASRRRRQASA
ncbi:MAG: PEP-CTERM sorting domain-containing protein [Cyanobacteria bacterium J06581_3]